MADARARLRKQFRQRMSIGAWKDLYTHTLRRVAHVNPTPAAEAKMLREKVEQNSLFREKRVAVARRRLDEGEALGGRAAAGRGRARGDGSDAAALWGSTAASEAFGLARSGGGDQGGDGSGRETGGGSAGGGAERAQATRASAGNVVGSNDLSPAGGRLRTTILQFAPSHLTTQRSSGSSGGGGGGSSSSGSEATLSAGRRRRRR